MTLIDLNVGADAAVTSMILLNLSMFCEAVLSKTAAVVEISFVD